MSRTTEGAGSQTIMTDLEARLSGADARAQREAILDRLAQIEARLGRSMAHGLSRSNFGAWQQALAAVVAAQDVIDHLPPAMPGTPPSTIEGLFGRAS